MTRSAADSGRTATRVVRPPKTAPKVSVAANGESYWGSEAKRRSPSGARTSTERSSVVAWPLVRDGGRRGTAATIFSKR